MIKNLFKKSIVISAALMLTFGLIDLATAKAETTLPEILLNHPEAVEEIMVDFEDDALQGVFGEKLEEVFESLRFGFEEAMEEAKEFESLQGIYGDALREVLDF